MAEHVHAWSEWQSVDQMHVFEERLCRDCGASETRRPGGSTLLSLSGRSKGEPPMPAGSSVEQLRADLRRLLTLWVA